MSNQSRLYLNESHSLVVPLDLLDNQLLPARIGMSAAITFKTFVSFYERKLAY